MNQPALPFDWTGKTADRDFLVTDANRDATLLLDRWTSWPVRTALLVGPPQSGRSLLARLFVAKSGGAVIDDADSKPEDDLFHAWNAAQASGKPLLMIAAAAVPLWDVQLPDLRSRLGATPVAAITGPDIGLCEALLVRGLGQRGLMIGPDVAAYIALRMKREYAQVQDIIRHLDERSLSERRALTLPFVRECLSEGRQIDLGL